MATFKSFHLRNPLIRAIRVPGFQARELPASIAAVGLTGRGQNLARLLFECSKTASE
jgi:hypothetical protein